jgi:hypothetical protein
VKHAIHHAGPANCGWSGGAADDQMTKSDLVTEHLQGRFAHIAQYVLNFALFEHNDLPLRHL